MYSLTVNECISLAPGENNKRATELNNPNPTIHPKPKEQQKTQHSNHKRQLDDVRSSKSSAQNLNSALFTSTIPLVDLRRQPDRS